MNTGWKQPNRKSQPGETGAGGNGFQWDKVLFGALLLGLGVLLGRGLSAWTVQDNKPSAPETVSTNALPHTEHPLTTGPWGTWEVLSIEIERPDEFIPSHFQPDAPSTWFFEGFSANQLTSAFDQPDLTKAQQTILLNPNNWSYQTNGILVTPGSETIIGLSPQARQRIYSILAASPVNLTQRLPFRFQRDTLNAWLAHSELSPEITGLIQKLLYVNGDSICFADVNEVSLHLKTDDEKHRLMKLLSRQSVVLAKLHIQEGQDIEPLVKYWGAHGRSKDIRPLLESLARIPGGAMLDINHLLTPFARMRLYTYPYPSEDPVMMHHDCYWTAMNFFNEEPDERFCEFSNTLQTIRKEFYPVQSDAAYGDVICLVDPGGQLVHAAVYIAGNIVFTKNGANFDQPWMLVKLEDLLDDYSQAGQEPRIVIYRRKNS